MDSKVLKKFHLFYKEANKKNRVFANKVKKIEPAKDLYYAYALDRWNVKDELLKCVLAAEVYKEIEEFSGLVDHEKKRLLLYVFYALSVSCLREGITNHALALAVIHGGIGDNRLERIISIDWLEQAVENEWKKARRGFSSSRRIKHLAEVVDAVFFNILSRLQNEKYFYISLVDGSYWYDLAEIVEATNTSVGLLLADMIAKRQCVEKESTSDAQIDKMEYVKSVLSGFYRECTADALKPWGTTNVHDKFGAGFAQYIEYMVFIKNIQMIMPSWVKFSNYQSEHKKIAFDQMLAEAPSSPLYWFCAIDLECTKFLNKRKNTPTVADIYEIINYGVSGLYSRKNFPIKFLNTNLPADTAETNLLKAEVRTLLDNKKLLSATVEYAYYLSCLHERLGVTDKRKSWFKKNINYILDSYEKYLYVLRRTFVVIERRKRKKQELESAYNEFHGQDWKLQERQERHGESDAQNLALSGQDSKIVLEDKESSFQWKCLENNIFIQSQHDNPNNLILLDKTDALDQIDKHLSKKRMDSMTTPEMILSVLDYYMEVCSQGLQDRLSLQVDDVIWSKISKGKIRLLVRTVPTGLVFHVYKRKDFVSSMFD